MEVSSESLVFSKSTTQTFHMPSEPAADLSGRRPLQSRSTAWARALSSWLTRQGVAPNAISAASVGFSVLAVGVAWLAVRDVLPQGWAWLTLAVCVQLRLLCNLMDGMVAVEGGKKSPTGDLWNELPDRFADAIFLLTAGWLSGAIFWAVAAGLGALMTAYVRALGHGLTRVQDFAGPGAKPQRMALLTLGALVSVGGGRVSWAMPVTLMLITGLTWATVFLRMGRLARRMKNGGTA